jgi:hypothetical protein
MARFRIDNAYFERIRHRQDEIQGTVKGLEKKQLLCPVLRA